MSEESPETDDSGEIRAAEQRRLVRDRYGGIAGGSTTGCGDADDAASSCCSDDSEAFIREWDDERDLSDYIVSATIEARKPPQ